MVKKNTIIIIIEQYVSKKKIGFFDLFIESFVHYFIEFVRLVDQ